MSKDTHTGKILMETSATHAKEPVDMVLFAIGRGPLTRALELSAAGVKTDDEGYVHAFV